MITAPTAPARSLTSSRPRTLRFTFCTAPLVTAWAAPTWRALTGGLEAGYEILIEMDADYSHQPEQLPSLVRAPLRRAPIWPSVRVTCRVARRRTGRLCQILSRGANLYTRMVLGTSIKDITAGFRAYRREALQRLNLDGIDSEGYVFPG